MAVKLRLRRQGRKGRPYYHIVAADARSPRDGKYLERVGSYDPTTVPASIDVDHETALKWLQNGAQPTDTVRAIFRFTGINLKFALMKQGKDEETVAKMFNKWWEDKQKAIEDRKSGMAAAAQAAEAEALKREAKIREDKAAAIAARNAPPVEEVEVAEEAPAAEEVAETPEAEAEVVAPETEAPAVEEVKEEAPVAEEEAPAEEEKVETPVAEAEAPAAEEAKEEAASEEE